MQNSEEMTWEDVFLMCKMAGIKWHRDWSMDTYVFMNPATQMTYQVAQEWPEGAVRVLFRSGDD